MLKILLLCLSLFSSIVVFAQYCATGGPTSTADSNLEGLSIVGASGSINFVGCPGVIGVQYYNSQTVTLNAGSAYSLQVQFGTCGGNYSGVGQGWIDFNGDGIFASNESLFTWSGIPPVAANTYVVNVPASAVNGMTRMRIIQAEAQTLPLDPCAQFTWGSTTDFNVFIQGGVDCSAYVGDDRFDPRSIPSIPFTEMYNSSFCYSDQNPTYSSTDVFYRLVPGNVEAVKISLCGSSFDTFLSVLDKNGFAILGNDDAPGCGTSSELELLTEGYDTLFVVVEGWGLASGDYILNITESSLSTQEIQKSLPLIYPNPTKEKLNFSEPMNGNLTVFDTQGKSVLTIEMVGQKTIDVSSLVPGFYYIQLEHEGTYFEQKIVVQ